MLHTMFNGLAMALADSVPGVSGGTIAYILGFYERFINALHALFSKNPAQRMEAIIYFCKFGMGWLIGMGSSVMILTSIFDTNIYFLSSVFVGLTAAAIPYILRAESATLSKSYSSSIFVLIGALMVVLLTASRSLAAGAASLNLLNLTLWQHIYLVIVGILAISAMLLPGISGSTLLLILGAYMPIITAIKEVIQLNLSYLYGLLPLALGVILGMAFASGVIKAALCRYRTQMVYLIVGLMLGSIYAIIMGPTTLPQPQAPLNFASFDLFGFIFGATMLVGLEAIREAKE